MEIVRLDLVKHWMKFFEEVGGVYCQTILWPNWEEYGECKEPWQAAAFFLNGYAFERQGRSPNYTHAAVDAVKEGNALKEGRIDSITEEELWKSFKDKLGDERLNLDRQPLNPSAKSPHSKSLLRQLREGNKANLVKTTQDSLQQGEVQVAFEFVKNIRGVGPKISSFFLRDLKEITDINTEKFSLEHRFLLQPIDIWVRRTVKMLNNTTKTDKDVARFIVDHSNNPEKSNMGIWYFSARVCGSEYRHNRILERDIDIAKREWEVYLKRAQLICEIH